MTVNEDKIKEMLLKHGRLFDQEQLAMDAESEYHDLIKPWEKPEVVAWEVYLELLQAERQLEAAFESAWPLLDTLRFIISRGIAPTDAEDIAQKAYISGWSSFYSFTPTIGNWKTWVFMIARAQLNGWLRKYYRQPEMCDIDTAGISHVDRRKSEEVGWSIPVICDDWLKSRDARRVRLASVILDAYTNVGWLSPSGQEVADAVGVSRSTCWRLFKEFTKEVIKHESNH